MIKSIASTAYFVHSHKRLKPKEKVACHGNTKLKIKINQNGSLQYCPALEEFEKSGCIFSKSCLWLRHPGERACQFSTNKGE
ncbi:MAG: hypothetical protein WCP18_04175 [bacterium]